MHRQPFSSHRLPARTKSKSRLLPMAIMASSSPNVPTARYLSTKISPSAPVLTHIGSDGRPNMVDVGDKEVTSRSATASGRIVLNSGAFNLLTEDANNSQIPSTLDGSDKAQQQKSPITETGSDPESEVELEKAKRKARSKGNVLITAQLAAIMASKQTSALIPLCHPLPLTNVKVELNLEPETSSVLCTATVRCDGKTGVEMEALTAVSVGLLTVWDMLKAVAGKEMIVSV